MPEPEKPKNRLAVHHSSATCEWETPPSFYAKLDLEFGFNLDVCASAKNNKCPSYFDIQANGLLKSWTGRRCWMNPPYGREIGHWMRKAHVESQTGAIFVVCLVPARSDTNWWWDHVMPHEHRLLKGRLNFLDADGIEGDGAPFPAAVVIMRNPALLVWPAAPIVALPTLTKPTKKRK